MSDNRANIFIIQDPRQPRWLVLVLSWLVPGYGFFVHGLRRRAILVFTLIQITFLAGVAFRGGVLVPEFRWNHEGFNIVSLLTFFTQIFNGGAALLSMLPEILGPQWTVFPSDETSPWADLGSFFLLVAGGLNYFVLMSTYDHFYGRKRPSGWMSVADEEASS